jgi:hypothetical protein
MQSSLTRALGLQVLAVAAACQTSNTAQSRGVETGRLHEPSEQLVAAEAQRNIEQVLAYYAADAIIEPPAIERLSR